MVPRPQPQQPQPEQQPAPQKRRPTVQPWRNPPAAVLLPADEGEQAGPQQMRRAGRPLHYALASGWIAPNNVFHPLAEGELHGDFAARHLGVPDRSKAFDQLHRTGWVRVAAPGHFGQSIYKITTHNLRSSGPRDRIADFLYGLPANQEVQVGDESWQNHRGLAHDVVGKLFGSERMSRPGRPHRNAHPDRDAFLNTIADNPLDDAPKLVYADWLEDPDRNPRPADHAAALIVRHAAKQKMMFTDSLPTSERRTVADVDLDPDADVTEDGYTDRSISFHHEPKSKVYRVALSERFRHPGYANRITQRFHAMLTKKQAREVADTLGKHSGYLRTPAGYDDENVPQALHAVLDERYPGQIHRMARVPMTAQTAKPAHWRAPAGGQVVRGTFYQGGKLVPGEATGKPVKPKTRKMPGLLRELKNALVVKYARTSDDEAFRNAVDEDPHDDAPKLVYADWLDEHGRESEANIWREMVAAKGDEDLHPKGILVEHPSIHSSHQAMNLWDRFHRAKEFKAFLSDDGEGRAFSYLSDPAGGKSAGNLWTAARRKDSGDMIDTAHEAVAFPVSSREANHALVGSQPPTSHMRQPTPMYFPSAHADYLVGKPTEVHDLIHEIRHGSRTQSQEKSGPAT